MKGKIQILGCGGSLGTPPIGAIDTDEILNDPYNARLRTSALIHIGQKKILIDPGPDFRQQALKYRIHSLDGVLITHTHYDHIAGLDELRVYYFLSHQPLPLLLSKESYYDLKKRCDYLLDQSTQVVNKDQKYHFHFLENNEGMVSFCEENIQYFSYEQAMMKITGYRIGKMAFVTDIKQYDPSIFEHLQGIDLLFVSALRYEPSPVHLNVEEAIDFAKKTGAKQTFFIHISHSLKYHETNQSLPQGIQLAYDGMEVEFDL